MRIAVPHMNGMIFQHFGHTQEFKVYDVEDKKVVSTQILSTNGSGHGALATFLKELNVDVVICGGIGGGAKTALANAGITLYGGVLSGTDEAVRALLNGILLFNPNVQCTHHAHEEGHACGDHGCGSHSCH
jgi:predicted Fe-Mo cluster-binding NifX family protein